MPKEFARWGIRFEYPENWELQEETSTDGCQAVTVFGSSGGFWTLSIHEDPVDPKEMVTAALEAIQQEYENAEVERTEEQIGENTVAGGEARFYYLDLTNTVCVRSAMGDRGTYVVFYQDEDRDFKGNQAVFEAITASFFQSVRRLNAWDEK